MLRIPPLTKVEWAEGMTEKGAEMRGRELKRQEESGTCVLGG
jgi:hypothetical protein